MLLDLVRGVAALLVVGEHWRNLFFVDYPQISGSRLVWAPMYLLTAAGHQAVIIFFVLSGFLISGSVFRLLARGRWSLRSYAIHRLVRLWVVLLPGLVLCALLDHLGLWMHRAPALYGGAMMHHVTPHVASFLTWKIFFANLFFLQGFRFPMFGSDGSLWSLSYEFWYYVLFPLGLFALRRGSWKVRLFCVAFFFIAAWFVGFHVLLGFPVWLLGTLLVFWKPKSLQRPVRYATAAVYVVLLFAAARSPVLPGWPADLLVGVATTVLLWVLLSARHRAREASPFVRLSRNLARFSYTLYVVHTPILVLLASVTIGDMRWQPGWLHLLLASGPLLLTLVLAFGVAAATEFQTDRIRTSVQRYMS